MLRNREIFYFILFLCFISILSATIALITMNALAAVFVFIVSILLIACFLLFTKWRYRELEKLSGYLHQISNGDFRLDVRDNKEGELSLLKNNIYKVTIMLSEQSIGLQEEKNKLTSAISDISHQLKTPLTSLMVMADLLSSAQLSEEKRIEFIKTIQNQLERMDWLVSSLLKLSKIDAGTVTFKKEPILLTTLIQSAMKPLLVPMEIKMQTYSITGDNTLTLMADKNWTVEAFTNMLKNCVEHTDKHGKISIHFTENVLYTEIHISDNGKGIPRDELPHIFKRFYKGKQASDDSVGIGLAMAHSIITSQDGDIKVTSTLHEGTTFHIKFYKQAI